MSGNAAGALALLIMASCDRTGGDTGHDAESDVAQDVATEQSKATTPAKCDVASDGGVADCPAAEPVCMTVFHGDLPGDANPPSSYACISLGACATDPTCTCIKQTPPNELDAACAPFDYTFQCSVQGNAMSLSCQR